MPLKAQTAKLVAAKKISEHDTIAAAIGSAPRRLRISMPANTGTVTAAKTTRVTAQSSLASATLLRMTAASGTISASAGRRRVRPANRAVAATGQTPGACGSSRAVTSRATRKATMARSIQSSCAGLGRLLHRAEVL